MQGQVKLFVIPGGRDPAGPPEPARDLVVEASSRDALREAARAAATEQGLRVRSVSFGPDGLLVYALERP